MIFKKFNVSSSMIWFDISQGNHIQSSLYRNDCTKDMRLKQKNQTIRILSGQVNPWSNRIRFIAQILFTFLILSVCFRVENWKKRRQMILTKSLFLHHGHARKKLYRLKNDIKYLSIVLISTSFLKTIQVGVHYDMWKQRTLSIFQFHVKCILLAFSDYTLLK